MDKPIALIFLSIAENTKSFAEEIKYTIHSKKVMSCDGHVNSYFDDYYLTKQNCITYWIPDRTRNKIFDWPIKTICKFSFVVYVNLPNEGLPISPVFRQH